MSMMPRLNTRQSLCLVGCLIAVQLMVGGCVRRTVTIDSDPPGALVWLNDREVGRTPVDVDFLFYGEYDVRLESDETEPVMTTGEVKPPLWDMIPIDFAAEFWPGELPSHHRLHYELDPRDDDPEALLERARSFRQRLVDDGVRTAESVNAP